MFRGMSEERVTLEFLGKQLERVIAEQNSTRGDLRVLTTIVLRLEGTLNGFSTNCTQWYRSTLSLLSHSICGFSSVTVSVL